LLLHIEKTGTKTILRIFIKNRKKSPSKTGIPEPTGSKAMMRTPKTFWDSYNQTLMS
jgi:hypothetical protein